MTAWRESEGRKRVALAGFGVVGQGVYESLRAAPDLYEVVGIVCRDPARRAAEGGPADLLTDDFYGLADYDLLVEVVGGVAPADRFVLSAFERGADVVSANKTLVSRRYDALVEAAAKAGRSLRFSAAVGGGVPMLEAVEARAEKGPILRIDAVLNGTTNFVLDRMGDGLSLSGAVLLAQEAGFAEADPSADIDGVDAAEKLSLLARRGFGAPIDPDRIARDRLGALSPEAVAKAAAEGAPIKQVGSAWRTEAGVAAEVRLIPQPAGAPLAAPRLEENCIVITEESGGRTILHGKGAGRGPTAESVMSDIAALSRAPAPA